MEKTRKNPSVGKQTYRTVMIGFALICVIVAIVCFQYYRKLQSTVEAESGGYLQEISKQVGVNVSKTIGNNFSVLGTIASVLKSSDNISYEKLQQIIDEQQNYWNYKSIMLVDEDGIAHNANGDVVSLGGGEYLRDVILRGVRSMSSSQLVDGKECIVFAIPLNGVSVDGTNMRALVTSYDLTTFDQILSMSAFDGQGYAHVIRKDGSVVIRSSSQDAALTGYNILNSIADAKFYGDRGLSDVLADINNGKSGLVKFSSDNNAVFMAYTPLNGQDWYLLTLVPVSVVNSKSELLLKITLLLCAFITLVFALLVAYLMLSTRWNKRKLENIAYVDPVTGGNTIQRFYEIAQECLDNQGSASYALVYTNIEKFKVLNEQFGRDTCDRVLSSFESAIHKNLSERECSGRLFADNFCVLLKYEDEEALAQRFDTWYSSCTHKIETDGAVWLSLRLSFGVYLIGSQHLPLVHMVDRAKLALRDTSREHRGKLRYSIFDEKERHLLFREKQLEDMMDSALENREFQVYFQPKYLVQSELIGGAEALVRWVSPAEGMIYPDEFISLFERNGFIIQLDLWVFEEVCITLRRWLDEGLEPVKVSINCSRIHLKTPGFLNQYRSITDLHNVPPHLIEIELTENVVFEDVERLTQTIGEIHAAGFSCSMDDFGSGYSSLNLIQDIPVDVLKLDRIFFHNGEQGIERTEAVVGSIINMARALSMETVAEGVELRLHVDMLKRLGCDYIQGYFFAKPMPISDFEHLLFAPLPDK